MTVNLESAAARIDLWCYPSDFKSETAFVGVDRTMIITPVQFTVLVHSISIRFQALMVW